MRVNRLDHVNIRTPDLKASIHFYQRLMNFTAKNEHGMRSAEESQWLYDQQHNPIVHLSLDKTVTINRDWPIPLFEGARSLQSHTLPIHHIALSCSGKQEFIDTLKLCGAEYAINEVPALNMTQIFTRDPHGILLELNFLDEGQGSGEGQST